MKDQNKSRGGPDWISVLRKAGLAGRKAILQNYDTENRNKVIKKGVGGDMTLRIDEASEDAIYDSLKKDLGEDSFVFLSEEVGEVKPAHNSSDALPLVICDPLDGSHNAQVGIPFFSLSLSVLEPGPTSEGGLRENAKRNFGSITSALILSMNTEDEFSARKGGGAYHNGDKLHAGSLGQTDEERQGRQWQQQNEGEQQEKELGRIGTLLVETGDIDFLRDEILSKFSRKQVYKTRLLGSAALSFCMLANGSADALIFAQPGGARTIDSPAGYLICREAGCSLVELPLGASPERSLEDVNIGFESRVNILGASSELLLSNLKQRIGGLP